MDFRIRLYCSKDLESFVHIKRLVEPASLQSKASNPVHPLLELGAWLTSMTLQKSQSEKPTLNTSWAAYGPPMKSPTMITKRPRPRPPQTSHDILRPSSGLPTQNRLQTAPRSDSHLSQTLPCKAKQAKIYIGLESLLVDSRSFNIYKAKRPFQRSIDEFACCCWLAGCQSYRKALAQDSQISNLARTL